VNSIPRYPRRRPEVAVQVEYGVRAETNLDEWAAAHADGTRPDVMPYGLSKMGELGITLETASLQPLSTWQMAALATGKPTRREAPDWAIAWDEHAALRLLATRSARRFASGIIWQADGLAAGGTARGRARLMLHLLRHVDLFFCLSRAQLSALRHDVLPGRTRIEYLPFGIDSEFFAEQPLPARPSVLSVGNDQHRDTPTLLAALDIVKRARPETELRVQFAGEHALPPGVERLTAMTHDSLKAEYGRARVVATATRPNLHVSGLTATLEAMSTGRAAVLTCSPGADDYVRHGETGMLVVPADPEALAGGILHCLDETNAIALGTAARHAVEKDFTSTLMAHRLGELLAL
jgi:glycosyltransferase involved in cell wall biosynthesis